MKLKDASLLRTQSYINGEWVGADDAVSYTHLTLPTKLEV